MVSSASTIDPARFVHLDLTIGLPASLAPELHWSLTHSGSPPKIVLIVAVCIIIVFAGLFLYSQ